MNVGESSNRTLNRNGNPPAEPELDAHLIQLWDGWSVWRTACLRGAGFNVKGLDSLVAPDTDVALEHWITKQQASDDEFVKARDICWARVHGLEGDARRPWRRVLRRLDKGKIPLTWPVDHEFETSIAAVSESLVAVESAYQTYCAEFARETSEIRQSLRKAAAEPRFREAVIWQNRPAVKNGFDHLLRQAVDKRGSQVRRHELLVARYLQRYCATNESIGFFGPIGWGEFSEQGVALELRPGPALLTSRSVHFEYWAIDALVNMLMSDPGFRAEMTPYLSPSMRIVGSDLYGHLGRRTALRPEHVALLKSLDGKIRVKDLAGKFAVDPGKINSLLLCMAKAGVIVWRPAILVDGYPERSLQACLDQIEDRKLRQQFGEPVHRLIAARDGIAQAAGNPEQLDRAIAHLETQFHDITGSASHRNEGLAYAGRALIYEDCVRDVELSIGPQLLKELGPPLSLMLHSARWFTWQLAEQFMEFVHATLKQCQDEAHSPVVELEHLWTRLQAANNVIEMIVADVVEQLQQRWVSILSRAGDERRVQYTEQEIRSQVLEVFAAAHPGWPGARYHSPDIMIAADSVDAIRKGQYQLVLGEIHAGGNSLAQNIFIKSSPRPHELVQALELDSPQAELVPLHSRSRTGHRMLYDPHTAHDVHVTFDDTASWRPSDQALPISSLVVENSESGMTIRCRDSSQQFPAMAFFGPQIRGLCVNEFSYITPSPHSPRITIDRLVISRETWRFALAEIEFINTQSALERFAQARRWAHGHNLPRQLFARIPGEKKPIYVDLKSPVSVDLLAKMLRGVGKEAGTEFSVSEMLPTPDQTWLTDAEGQRYTSELRIAAVDPRSWAQP